MLGPQLWLPWSFLSQEGPPTGPPKKENEYMNGRLFTKGRDSRSHVCNNNDSDTISLTTLLTSSISAFFNLPMQGEVVLLGHFMALLAD